ncbi:MAG: hypothetical protein ACHQT9_03970 [Candidatus Saccharimonadales bacterium]
MKHFSIGTIRSKALFGVFLILFSLFVSSFFGFFENNASNKVSADSTFQYTNAQYSAITGPSVASSGAGVTLTYTKQSGNVYVASFGGADQWSGCTTGIIKVTSYGAGSGYAYQSGGSGCTDNGKSGQTIAIQGGSTKAGSTMTGSWIDFSHISASDGNVYYDAKIDNNLHYDIQGGSGCSTQNYIDGFPAQGSNYKNATATAKIHIFAAPGNGNNNCIETPMPIKLSPNSDPASFNYTFVWADQGTIATSDQTALIFTLSGQGKPYLATSGRSYDSKCQSQITGAPGWPYNGTLIIRNSSSSNPLSTGFQNSISSATLKSDGQGCYVSKGIGIQIGDPLVNGKKASDLPAGTSTLGSGTNGANGSVSGIGCDLGINGLDWNSIINIFNPLNWLMCGLIQGATSITAQLDQAIQSWLVLGTGGQTNTDNPDFIFFNTNGQCNAGAQVTTTTGPESSCNAYETAWGFFEGLALALLAIAALFIIISQALGLEILDAYTIRKMLPRVVIGAILVTISWPLMKFLVTLSNDLGYGITFILNHSFGNVKDTIDTHSILTTLGLAIGGLALGFFGLLSFVATAALSVIVAFVAIVFRQIVVIFLIIISPVAIVLYALPNTQRYSRMWWDNLIKLLLMFPMIVGIITMGHIFSALTSQMAQHIPPGQTVQAGTLNIIALIAYFAPYFAIPFTFRFAGGIMSAVGGAINSRADGARGALSKYRSNQLGQNSARLKAGTRFEDKPYLPTRLTRGLNTASRGLGTGWKGRYGLGARGQSARGYVQQAAVTEAQKSQGMQGIRGNNKANRFLAEAMGDEKVGREALYKHLMSGGDLGDEKWTSEDALAAVDRAVLDAKSAGQVDAVHGAAAFMSMAADGTAIRDTNDLARLAAKAGQADKNTTFHYAASAASISRQAGRPDLAAASEPIGELAFAYSDKEFNKTPGMNGMGSPDKKFEALQAAAWESGAGGEVAYNKYGTAKSRTIRNDTRGAVEIMKNHQAAMFKGEESPYSQEQVQFAAASLVEARNAVANNYGKLNNRIAAGKELEKDDGALDWYLDSMTTVGNTSTIANSVDDGTAVQAGATNKVTNRDVINKMVGDRIQNMSPAEREAAERSRARPDTGGDEEA